MQTVSETEFGRHESQRIAGGFARQRRAAAQTRIHLDYAVVLAFGVEGVLHVAFADDAHVPDDFDGQFAQLVVFGIRERLRRSHHDALAGMDAQRVEVLHVADRYAVVETVANNLVLDLFPAFERFLDQNLRRICESLAGQRFELGDIVAEAGTQTAERVCRADDDWVAQFGCHNFGVLHGGYRMALYGLYINLVEFFDEFFAVFGVDNRLHGSSEHLDVVFFEHSALVQLHSAVQGRLTSECQQYSLRAFAFDDLLDEFGRYGQEVDAVGYVLRGLNRRDVRVDEYGVDTLLFESFERLGAGIVELSRLADFQRSRTEQYHLFYLTVHCASLYCR